MHAEMVEPKVGLVVIQTCTLLVLATTHAPPGAGKAKLGHRKPQRQRNYSTPESENHKDDA